MPALSPEHAVPWIGGTLQSADAALLVIDLGDADCVEEVRAALAILKQKRVSLTERWPAGGGAAADPVDENPFAIRLPTLLLANKAERIADFAGELAAFRELSGARFSCSPTSGSSGSSSGHLLRRFPVASRLSSRYWIPLQVNLSRTAA